MTGSPEPLDVLVVGWFPAADDTIAGRFVADQVAALHAAGRVKPTVVSFENAPLRGQPALRSRQETAIAAATRAAIGGRSPFNPAGSGGPAGVPVARLAIAAGTTAATGADHRAIHRASAIAAVADRPDRPDWRLIHAHVGYPEAAAALPTATRLGIPLVVTEHASFIESFLAEPVVRERYLETLLGAARVVAVSQVLADELEAAVPALAGRLVVIPNAVAVDEFKPTSAGRRAPAELLYVGYRKEAKGIATLLRGFKLILAERPDATLRLIGRATNGAEEAGWHRLAAELKISAAVRFEPPADRAGVVAAMRRASCFVHASTRETFGVVVVEALAAGLPVVATDSGGVTEILGADPDAFGALVPPADPPAFAAAVIRTLDRLTSFDPSRLHDYAQERFAASAVAGRLVALYDEVLEEALHGASPASSGAQSDRPGTPLGAPGGDAAGLVDPDRILVVAFGRTELERALARFPAASLAGVEIVTCGPPLAGRAGVTLAPAGTDERLADLLDWGAPEAGAAARLRRRLRRRGRLIAARLGRPAAPGDALIADLTRTLERAVGPAGAGLPLLVCLGGIDYLAAAPLVAAGRARPGPGGLRWLADLRAIDPTQAVAASDAREA